MTTSTKLHVPVITLSIKDNIKFWENIKQGFKRTISWNKYRFEITTQTKNNILDYLTDPTFRNIKRLFLFSFENCSNGPARDSFDKFVKCITKNDETTTDDAKDLDLVMPIYNLIEYSSETTGSLWFYFKDEATNFNTDITNDDNFKSLNY